MVHNKIKNTFSKVIQQVKQFFAPPAQVSKPLTQSMQKSIPRNVPVQLGLPQAPRFGTAGPAPSALSQPIKGINVNLGQAPSRSMPGPVQQQQQQGQPAWQRGVESVMSAVTPTVSATEFNRPTQPTQPRFDFSELLKKLRMPQPTRIGEWGTKDYGLTEKAAGFLSGGKTTDLFDAFKQLRQPMGVQYPQPGKDDVVNQSFDPRRFILDAQGKPIGSRAPVNISQDTSLSGRQANIDKEAGSIQTGYGQLEKDIGIADAAPATPTDDSIFDMEWEENRQAQESGTRSLEEATTRNSDIAQRQSEAIWQRHVDEAKALIPNYEAMYNLDLGTARRSLAEGKEGAALSRTAAENQYGEMIRGITKRKNVDTTQLKNIFSALGTADSSEFMNRAFGLEQSAGEQTGQTERAMMDRLSSIDRDVRRIDADSQDRISKLIMDKNAKIDAANRNINISTEQKAFGLDKINADLQTSLASIKSDMINKKHELLMLNQSIIENRRDIADTGQINMDLIREQGRQDRMSSTMAGLLSENDINELRAPRSSIQKQTILNRLLQQFPDKAALIQAIGAGTGDVDELLRQLQ